MTMALLDRRANRLAAPTETMTARPEAIRRSPTLTAEVGEEASGVTAVLDQAEHLVTQHPTSAAAFARLAHAALAVGNEGRARRAARQVLAIDSATEDPPSLVAAAQVLTVTGDSEIAEQALARLGGRWFSHLYAQFAVERGDLETALGRLGEVADPVGESLRGWLYLQSGRFEEAIRTFRRVVALGFVSPELYVNLGYAYGAVGSLSKAVRATQSAVGLAPANRTASFNLAAFRAATEDEHGAVAALRKLAAYYPETLSVAFAIAETYSQFRHYDAAERELRRASTSQAGWAADPIERLELKANIAALQGLQGKLAPIAVRTTIFECLEGTGYQSLSLGRMLAPMFGRVSDRESLAGIYEKLSRLHPAEELLPLAARTAFLGLELEKATELAEAWMASDPFDVEAASMVTYLLIEVKGDAEAAARIGRTMLRRYPHAWLLANNTAYALVLLDQCKEAQKLLAGFEENSIAIATKALAEVRSGNIEQGLELYKTAATAAQEAGYLDMADLIRYCSSKIANLVGYDNFYDAAALAPRLADDPHFHVLERSEALVRLFT